MTRIMFEVEDELSKRRYEPNPEIIFSLAHQILNLCFSLKPAGKNKLNICTSSNGYHFVFEKIILNDTHGRLLVDLRRDYEQSSRVTIFVRKNGRRTNKDNGVDGIIIPCIVQLRFTHGRADQDVSVYELTCRASQRGVSAATLTKAPHY